MSGNAQNLGTDQGTVQEIKRYLHKIIRLKTCYSAGLDQQDTWTMIQRIFYLFTIPDRAQKLKSVAQELKELAKENPYHEITICVASDSIHHLTNDFVLRSEQQKALYTAVKQVREEEGIFFK